MPDTEGAVLDAPIEETASAEPRGAVIVSYWLSDAARTRLTASGPVHVVDDVERVHEAALIAVSTRIPAGQSPAVIAELRSTVHVPIVAIVHPGGEATAVDLVQAGATGLVAEGNEEAVGAYLGEVSGVAGLVDTFEQRFDRRASSGRAGSGDRDPITNLRGPTALASRLAGGTSGVVPRLAALRLVGFDDATRRMSVDARDLLRRRLALQVEELCRHHQAEVFSRASDEFAVVTEALSLVEFEALGRALIAMAAGFSPDRAGGMLLAFGHAGPEATSQVDTLIDLAERGMRHAAEHPDLGVMGADRLAFSLAAGTELAAALQTIESVEARDAYPGAHGERVARFASAIGDAMGLPAGELLRLRVAARFHDIGKIRLGEGLEAHTADSVDDASRAAYLEHATAGAELLRASAGDEVADAIATHHEHWDGTGGPGALAGEDIPLGGRVLAVADALDRWSVNGTAPDHPTPAAVQRLVDASGSLFDPAVADVAAKVFTP